MTLTPAPTLLVLAAGMGSRYGGLKQIRPVGPGGEAIIDYSVFDALRAGFGKLVFVIRKEIEPAFKEFVGARFEDRIAVEYVYQELDRLPPGFTVPPGRTKPWGTAHAILMGAEAIGVPFAVINADDFYGAQGFQLLANYLRSGATDYALAGFTLRNTLSEFGAVARGVCQVGSGGYLRDVVEHTHIERKGSIIQNTDVDGRVTQLTGDETVSMNMWGFTPAIFEQLREEFRVFLDAHGEDQRTEWYIPYTITNLITQGLARVRVLPTSAAWFGVTYREDHAVAVESLNRLIRDGYYPERLWS